VQTTRVTPYPKPLRPRRRVPVPADVPHAAYVAKPFDIDGLLGTLARVLASRRKGA